MHRGLLTYQFSFAIFNRQGFYIKSRQFDSLITLDFPFRSTKLLRLRIEVSNSLIKGNLCELIVNVILSDYRQITGLHLCGLMDKKVQGYFC